jgi:putative N6-adenine-specific DNA methylase
MKLYATIGVGLETIVSRELGALGITVGRVEPGRVRFDGEMVDLCRAIIHLRCVSRVVRELAFQEIEREQEIYDAVRALDWPALFSVDATFRVTFNVHSSLVRNSRFWTYRIKDAICDRFMSDGGRRPNVDTESAQVSVYCYLENRRLSIGLDAAGDPLHMRGYRVGQHSASLREHLAAAMLMHSGWVPSMPLHDPFCGSGTLLIEAALMATATPPSAFRARFACEAWTGFELATLSALRQQAMAARVEPPNLRISGGDIDRSALAVAKNNVRSAGFDQVITLVEQDVGSMAPVLDGVVIANPPYGVRAHGGDLGEVWKAFRTAALQCKGSTIVVLQASPEFEKSFSLRPFKKNRMNNGALECTLYQYRIHPSDG